MTAVTISETRNQLSQDFLDFIERTTAVSPSFLISTYLVDGRYDTFVYSKILNNDPEIKAANQSTGKKNEYESDTPPNKKGIAMSTYFTPENKLISKVVQHEENILLKHGYEADKASFFKIPFSAGSDKGFHFLITLNQEETRKVESSIDKLFNQI